MQVSVEQTSELSRKMTVSIPEDVIKEKVDVRLKSLAREIKIDGFRPGKVPQSLIKKRYSEKVRGEIAGDVIQSSYYEALQEQNLNPAGLPHIHPVEQEEGLAYTAEFEVYPEISLAGITDIEAQRPVAEVNDDDFSDMVEKLRGHKKEWLAVERASQDKDQMTINFSGVCEGKSFTDDKKIEDFKVEIGGLQMIPGFEDQLIGLEVGNNKTFEVNFPEGYTADAELAGKAATFEVEVIAIEEPQLPEIDAEFIEEYGIESGEIEDFYTDVRTNMESELATALREELKKSVLDAVYDGVNVTIPSALIDREVETMMKPYAESAKKQNMKLEDMNLPRDIFEEQAKRRVGLGLILGEIIEKNNITVNNDKVRSTIEDLAKSYDSPDEVMQWYHQDETRLNEVKQRVLEDQTVEWISGQIKMTDDSQKFSDIVAKHHQRQQQRG
ncbi:MAG: trigger factor [Methylococcaceae bacterium]|nr:trigger factor [Methylococcaceae bacterium]